jgi:hypothetical protein
MEGMFMDTDNQLETTPEQQQTPHALQTSTLPKWPTSKRGPMVTEPPPGTRPVHLRPEQVVEINYDQEHGKHEDTGT